MLYKIIFFCGIIIFIYISFQYVPAPDLSKTQTLARKKIASQSTKPGKPTLHGKIFNLLFCLFTMQSYLLLWVGIDCDVIRLTSFSHKFMTLLSQTNDFTINTYPQEQITLHCEKTEYMHSHMQIVILP